MRFLALDFETGGLDPSKHGLVTLGLAKFQDGELVESQEWLFKPELNRKGYPKREFTETARMIHHHPLEDLIENGIPAGRVYSQVYEWLSGWEDVPVVSHNAPFDSQFWSQFMFMMVCRDEDWKLVVPTHILTGPWFDTLRIASSLNLIPDYSPDLTLKELVKGFGIGEQGDIHGAEKDAILAGRLFITLRQKQGKGGA